MIVTPVYNGGAYIEQTLAAVQAQDYPNLLHIVLDNASTDGTRSILAGFEPEHVPLRISRNDVLLPLVQNWNAALSLIPADAKYFHLLCADDLIAPTYMSRMVAVGERWPNVGVVGCLFHENDNPPRDLGWPRDSDTIAGREAIARYFNRALVVPSLHALFRCSQLELQKPFFPEGLVATDVGATLGVLSRSDLGLVHEALATTRIYEGTLSSKALEREFRQLYEWLYFMERYAREANGREAGNALIQLYRRYYFRQLVKWRFGSYRPIYNLHKQGLASLGLKPSAMDIVDALWDWVLNRVGLRPTWQGYPRVDRLPPAGRPTSRMTGRNALSSEP